MYLLLDGDPAVGRALRGSTVAAVRAAGGKRIQVNVVDAAIGPPFGVDPDPAVTQVTAALSAWVPDDAPGLEAALPPAGETGAWYGYAVTEAEPRANTSVPPGPNGRVPGFAQLVLLRVPDDMSPSEWRERWEGHTSIALATQSTFRYVQNVIIRPLSDGAPDYVAVMEECFPMAAATDLQVFFDAVGDEAKLARRMAAMSDSCDRFMDGDAPVAWTAEYLFPEDE